MVDLSIIIVNFNLKDYLGECLLSIRRFPGTNRAIEIIVVDNNSSDGSREMLQQEFPEVHVFNMGENKGFPAATNEGIRNSQGKYILLLNNDAKLMGNTIDHVILFLDKHPEVGCLGCRHIGPGNRPQLTWGKFPSFLNELNRKTIHFLLKWGGPFYTWHFNRKYSGVFEIDWVSGSCLAIKREVIEQIGLLDENIRIYFEDIDWCYKIRRRGWQVIHHGNIPVFHYGGQSAKKFAGLASYQYRVSQLYFWSKYYPARRVWILRMLIIMRGITGFIRAVLKTVFSNGKQRIETREQRVRYSKDTIVLGWTGKVKTE